MNAVTGSYKRPRHPPSGLRSYLFAPGNHARRVEKVFAAGADVAILDLEDAVAIAEKEAARVAVVAALKKKRSCLGYVRVNAYDTRWCMADLEAVIGPWLDGIVVPKAESPEHLQSIAMRISHVEEMASIPPGTLDLMPIIETAKGVMNADAIAAASSRVRRIAFGGGDYTNDLDLEWTDGEMELAFARARLTHASRFAGLEGPVDTVYMQVNDADGFRRSARHGRSMGFHGKLCIHPAQIAPCHEVFTPSDAQIAHARAVIKAFADAEAQGSASIQLDGQFIDYPVVEKARRILAVVDRIESRRAPG